MKLRSLATCFAAMLLAGCLTAPVSDSGGMGVVIVPNTNVTAITSAAQNVFAYSGYSIGPVNYPVSISFDKPGGRFGKMMWGSFGDKVTIRVRLAMAQVPGTNDYRLIARVYSVTNAGESGFEDKHQLSGLWSSEFGPLLQQIKTQAANAGGI